MANKTTLECPTETAYLLRAFCKFKGLKVKDVLPDIIKNDPRIILFAKELKKLVFKV